MKVSLVIPTWNGEDTLEQCLSGVFDQEVNFDLEVLVIDSSSTDRTLEIARQYPVRIHRISQSEFSHGDTRNLGALLTDGELIVYLVQDAYPEGRQWLKKLVSNFEDPEVAGAFSRVVPRLEASALVRRGVEGDLNFGAERLERAVLNREEYDSLDPLSRRIFINFNDVASCLRRTVWKTLPFSRVSFGEDVLWARGALEAGHKIVFDPDAPVVHSHEYDPATLRARTHIDGWVNQAYLDRTCINSLRDVLVMTKRSGSEDRRFLQKQDLPFLSRLKQSTLSYYYHFLEFLGAWQGGHTEDRLRTPEAVSDESLKILFVVHAFPPESVAGTEVLTLSLAKALKANGHQVSIFHRVADPTREDYSLEETTLEGMKVYQVANQLRLPSIRETFHNRPVEDRFKEVLQKEKPDVVHFEHMIHLSVALPRICRERGIGTVVTLNDFWFRCPKVQLIRPNRTVCKGPPPMLGCAACVKGAPSLIDPLRALTRPIRRLLQFVARRAAHRLPREQNDFMKFLSNVAWLSLRPQAMISELLQADFVIAPSPFLKEKMVEAGVPSDRLVVSDYGMETDWLERYERHGSDDRIRFGFVGSLVWYKGLEVLARAFQLLGQPNVELHIHGDTSGNDEFVKTRSWIEEHVSRPGLFFHGRYEPGQVGEVLSNIDVLVVPSIWYENSPLAIHEAFLAGVPVLVSDQGGMKDLVREGEGGLRFQPGDHEDLARVMRRCLEDTSLAENLVRARPYVKTVAENAAEMEVKYRQAIGLSRPRPPYLALKPSAPFASAGSSREEDREALCLGPAAHGAAFADYEIMLDRPAWLNVVVTLLHLEGDGSEEQGGELLINGKRALFIGPSPNSRVMPTPSFLGPVRLGKGRSVLRVSNHDFGGTGKSFLRVAGIALHRTSQSQGASR